MNSWSVLSCSIFCTNSEEILRMYISLPAAAGFVFCAFCGKEVDVNVDVILVGRFLWGAVGSLLSSTSSLVESGG